MGLIRGLLGALVGGAIGAAIWAGVSYSTGYEVGWIAWAVGVLAGIGMAVGARDEQGFGTGATAAAVAIAAVMVGKYAAVHYEVKNVIRTVGPVQVTDEMLQVHLADQLVEEYERGGKPLAWPEGKTVGNAEAEADYPKALWGDMLTRWNAMTPEDREQRRRWMDGQAKKAMASMGNEVTSEGFLASFSLFDALWFLLAVGSAYRIGSGSGGE